MFHIPDGELATVARVFNLAKQDVAGYETYARQIAKLFEARSEVLEDVLDGLFHIAKADNAFHPGEHGFLGAAWPRSSAFPTPTSRASGRATSTCRTIPS